MGGLRGADWPLDFIIASFREHDSSSEGCLLCLGELEHVEHLLTPLLFLHLLGLVKEQDLLLANLVRESHTHAWRLFTPVDSTDFRVDVVLRCRDARY